MKVVGITGGIGSGKTTVARMFEEYGISVYYADDEAKNLNDTSEIIRNGLINLFGESIYVDAKLDRKKLAHFIFNDAEMLKKVNALIHPEVGKHFLEWISKQEGPYVLKEAAILFESGAYKQCDAVILVTAPEELRIQRVMKRDSVGKEEVVARMRNQWSEEDKLKLSDFVIENIDLTRTAAKVEELHHILSQR